MEYQVQGLNEQQVTSSREEHGSNQLTTIETESFWEKYWSNFQDPIITILIIALLINIVLAFLGFAKWYEGVGIAIAVLLATFVATFSEYKNESSFQKLQEEASKIQIKVFRNRELKTVNIDDIVVGDYVLLQPGDKVPADSLVISGEASLSQASLTGEPESVAKYPKEEREIKIPENTRDLLHPQLVFRGTVVTQGEILIEVIAVGDKTIYGEMAEELNTETRESPLQVKLSQLALGISRFGYIGATFIALSFMFKKIFIDNGFIWSQILGSLMEWQVVLHDFITALILAIIIIVVAVPEGLPMMIAIVLSLNMRKLLSVKVLVRKLIGIETSGSLNILFVDKTGTITKGQLEAVTFLGGTGDSYASYEEVPTYLRRLLYIGARYNNNCIINTSSTGEEQIIGGNPTERSLLAFVHKEDGSPEIQVKKTLPFSSEKKYSLAQVEGDLQLTLIKGAPEVILHRCKYYYTRDGERKNIENKEIGRAHV